MPRFILRASALALALAAQARASPPVSSAQVLDAIRVFEANASGGLTSAKPADEANAAVARASNTILRYSLESDSVVVDMGNDSVPWCDVKKGISGLPHSGERGLLLAAYLAGSVKAQLQSGKQDPNPYPGWVAMLRVYRAVKMREGVTIPEVDSLLGRQMDGTLESYAAAAVQRSTDSLRRAYGPGGAPRQIETDSSQP